MSNEDHMIWALVQFKPNSGALAERNLKRQGFEVFLPRLEKTVRRSGRFQTLIKPLFPGYLFAGIKQTSAGWRAINSTFGVSRIVTTGSEPTKVPDELVAALKARCGRNGIVAHCDSVSQGDTVKIGQGPFADWIGKIIDLTADKRAWVLLDLMGRRTKVAVNVQDLRAVS